MRKTRPTKTNRCTLTQQSERPLFPWRWLRWLAGSHLMRAGSLIWRDGALKDSNIHHVHIHSFIYVLPSSSVVSVRWSLNYWKYHGNKKKNYVGLWAFQSDLHPFTSLSLFWNVHTSHQDRAWPQQHTPETKVLLLWCSLQPPSPVEGVSVKCEWNRNKRRVAEKAVQQSSQPDYNWHP